MRSRKPIILLMAIILLFAFSGCKNNDTGAKELWDTFVSAVNSKNHEQLAKCFYKEGSSAYKMMIDNEENFAQYDEIDSIVTKSIDFTTKSDLSTTAVKQLYYSAKVEATVTSYSTPNELSFDIYMSNTNDNGWLFTSIVNVNPFGETFGNLPDDLWLKTALHEYEDFQYRPTYKLEPNSLTYSDIAIVKYNGKGGDVVIPDTIDELPVTTIKKFAFARFGKIFQITYPGSKIKNLTIGNNVTTIDEYAFFQSKKLKEVTIPSSVKTIGEYAFSSSKRLQKVNFIVNDSDLYTEEFVKEIESKSDFGIVIKGARNMYVGDIITLNEGTNKLVTWSVSSSNVATADADKGTITAKSSGNVTITCALKSDPTIKATVTINVTACPEKLKVQASAFERCNNLKDIYIYAINPNSFSIAGTQFKFPKGVKIYVPKGSKAMYVASATWSSYADSIFEME